MTADAAAAAAALAELPVGVGSMIAGKYRIDGVLGAGGMGVVVAATHVDLGQRVAVKLMLPNAARDRELMARFSREARMTAQLRSEHVARVLDVGTDSSGVPYIAMEHLEGADLSRLVRERGPLPVALAAEYVLQACDGIAEAHRLGMVHRDIKPANLFLADTADGRQCIKLLDFGIAKASVDEGVPAEGDGITTADAFMGSPLYMSPEQLRSARDVGPQSDLWSLGAVLHRLLTGRPPFDAPSTPELFGAILASPYRSMLHVRPDLPPAVDHVVGRCLEKELHLRYATVVELADALAPFAGGDGAARAARVRRMHGGVREPSLPPRGAWPEVSPSQPPPPVGNHTVRADVSAPLPIMAPPVGNTLTSSPSSRSFPPPLAETADAASAGGGHWLAAVVGLGTAGAIVIAAVLVGPTVLANISSARHPNTSSGSAASPAEAEGGSVEPHARTVAPDADTSPAPSAAPSASSSTSRTAVDAPRSDAGASPPAGAVRKARPHGSGSHHPDGVPDFGSRK